MSEPLINGKTLSELSHAVRSRGLKQLAEGQIVLSGSLSEMCKPWAKSREPLDKKSFLGMVVGYWTKFKTTSSRTTD